MDGSWVAPDACTLPTAERPLRVAEFDALFAGHLRCLEWHGRAAMSMDLSGDVGLTEAVRDLLERESACCSFFSFTVTTGGGTGPGEHVHLDVTVPPGREDVLVALGARATALGAS